MSKLTEFVQDNAQLLIDTPDLMSVVLFIQADARLPYPTKSSSTALDYKQLMIDQIGGKLDSIAYEEIRYLLYSELDDAMLRQDTRMSKMIKRLFNIINQPPQK